MTAVSVEDGLPVAVGLVWGDGGILCFGLSAFFGLGAYTYAVTALNLGESTLAILLSIVLPSVSFKPRIGDDALASQ